jgi:hypothetical protein
VEGQFEQVALKGTKVSHKETNRLGRNKELENTITKLGDMKMRSRTTNGGLEEERNRVRRQMKLASAKRHNKSKGAGREVSTGNRKTQRAPNLPLNRKTGGKRKPGERGSNHREETRAEERRAYLVTEDDKALLPLTHSVEHVCCITSGSISFNGSARLTRRRGELRGRRELQHLPHAASCELPLATIHPACLLPYSS